MGFKKFLGKVAEKIEDKAEDIKEAREERREARREAEAQHEEYENKVKEVRKILGKEFKIRSLNEIGFYDEIPENQPTIEGNAKFKSQYIFEKYNLNVFADDTGLEIKALNNEPGVRSARYAGDHKTSTDNINKVLKELNDFEDRSARFKTVFSLITKDFSKFTILPFLRFLKFDLFRVSFEI